MRLLFKCLHELVQVKYSDGLTITLYLSHLWYLKQVFCCPKTFATIWKTKVNGCDVLFMVALWVSCTTIYKYYPFGGNQYQEANK